MHLNELIRIRNLRVEPHHSSLSLVDTPAHHALQTSSSCWICCSNSSARVASIWTLRHLEVVRTHQLPQRMMKRVIFVIIKYLGPSHHWSLKKHPNCYMKWSSSSSKISARGRAPVHGVLHGARHSAIAIRGESCGLAAIAAVYDATCPSSIT